MSGTPANESRRFRRRLRLAVLAYVIALLASHIVRFTFPVAKSPRQYEKRIQVAAVRSDSADSQRVSIAYREYKNDANATLPTVILLHGSPGRRENFAAVAPQLADRYRVIVPDLPGFGDSTPDVPDYSIRAHARYVIALMDALAVPRAHAVGFSMGGGVAINLADIAPQRVASLTLLSSIGVQEMELLGDARVNHAVHGVQLALVWGLLNATPHFGLLDGTDAYAYARNFYDTDQRPLREILERYEGAALIVHGERDILVPVEAAREHQRLVPQSETRFFDDDHFMVFTAPNVIAATIGDFLDRAERGAVTLKPQASPERLARAQLPFDPTTLPKPTGIAAFVFFLLLALATFVSEDLACVAAGTLAAQGRIGFTLAVSSCLVGIFVGDVLLYLAGRWLGRPALALAPLRWFVSAEAVERGSAWFARRGAAAIFLSRFVPGTRLPTYFAAGTLKTSLPKFSFYFLAAAAVWTPLLVGASAALGANVVWTAAATGAGFSLQLVAALAVGYAGVRLGVRSATHQGRRRLVGALRRITRWEFWPPWMFYPPVILWIVWLALRHGGASFTAVNPAIPDGGFVGESKSHILDGLMRAGASRDFIAPYVVIRAADDFETRLARAETFAAQCVSAFPIVIKPDIGQRGAGVSVVRSAEELHARLSDITGDCIVQEYVSGEEFGMFYIRRPNEPHGRIFSVTEKRFPVMVGDGKRTLERLILDDERAVCMADFYCSKHVDAAWRIPANGETIRLVELGTHCRGAIFLDGARIVTPQLEAAIDAVARGFDGFYFGRFDIRTPNIENFKRGENFKIIELNGVTSEATHIYDPTMRLTEAYRTLFEQWRLAFEIGAENLRRGATATPLLRLAVIALQFLRG
jgi:pimeloyl-ACP methyl ester carboxylesterase/membrane protein DedA with SNARE-associated domain